MRETYLYESWLDGPAQKESAVMTFYESLSMFRPDWALCLSVERLRAIDLCHPDMRVPRRISAR